MKRKSIAFFNRKGGVGSTTNTAHLCLFGKELGLRVVGAWVDGPGDLRRWLRPAGIPCFDALRDEIPSDVDLVVFDVYARTKYDEVMRPNLWLVPVDYVEADLRAVALAPRLAGTVLRLPNFRLGVTCELSPELQSTNAVIPCCQALAATDGSLRAVWSTELGARSAGARSVRELGAELFTRVGLLSPEWDSILDTERDESQVDEREALQRLASFFADQAEDE